MAFLKSDHGKQTGRLLFGRQVVLSPPQMADYEDWAQLRAASAAFLRPFEPSWHEDELSRQGFRKRVLFYQRGEKEGSAHAFFIRSRDDGRLLGGITLSNIRYGVVGAGVLGYWIGRPFARRGLMSDALPAVLRFSFDTLGLHRVEAACLPVNQASIALLRKNGFVLEGLARKYLQINGEWRDHLLFALLEDDYLQYNTHRP